MIDDKFDSFLSNSLKAAEVEVNSDMNELERMIADRVSENRRMKKQKQLRCIQVAAALVLLIGISGAVFFPDPVSAIKKQLFQTIFDIGKSINISLKSDADQHEQNDLLLEKVKIVQQETPFKIVIPHYIPPGYSLNNIDRSSAGEQTRIVMFFVEQKSNIVFIQTRVYENFSSSLNIDAQEAKTKNVMVGGCEGNLVSFHDGSATLVWVTDDHVLCKISGDVSPVQAVEMAESVQ